MRGTHAHPDPWKADPVREMERLRERLAAAGVPLELSTATAADPLPELVVPRAPADLGGAVVEDREERGRAL